MNLSAEIRAAVGESWLPEIYETKVRTERTRSVDLDISERENQPAIQHTLLGVELKVGRRRIACPDLATARFLRVFARLGCRNFAILYDISAISAIADELESAWHRTMLEFEARTSKLSPQARGKARAHLLREMRVEIARIGAGKKMPLFNQTTRQRKSS